ncbi:MAG: hypothetical protein HOO86_06050 [Bacteroidales bacterium]|nr:hypothetical protein [Bacteroidales bacterium]
MKPKVMLRFASGILILFTFWHIAVHFTRHNTKDIRIQKVLKAMTENKFEMFGQLRSYDDNYNGMSLNLIFSLLAFSIMLWILSIFTERNRVLVRALLVPISFCLIGYSITGFLYFSPIPAYTSFIAAVLTIVCVFKMVNKNSELK